jgi:hypothetical protein
VHVAYVVIDAVIDLEWTRAMTAKAAGDPFFIQPAAIAEEVWHVVHQERSAWSFNVEIRPFAEACTRAGDRGQTGAVQLGKLS